MNREIKFRAWDNVNQKMYYDVQDSHSQIYTEILNLDFGSIISFPERFKLMQFTGLTAKKCKEIYEGDVVKVIYEEYPDEPTTHEVKYLAHLDYPAFDLIPGLSEDSNSLSYASFECSIDVVGNIFENPELLDK